MLLTDTDLRIANDYGVLRENIRRIRKRMTWKHI